MPKKDIYLFLGPEQGQKQERIQEIKKAMAKDSGEEPEYHKIYPFEESVADIVSLMRNGSLFSTRKLVVISDAHQLKQNDATLLADYCKSPAEGVCLIFVSEETPKKSINARITKHIPDKNTEVFWEMFENQKRSWIIAYFRKLDVGIAPEAQTLLLELVENNTADMKNTCDQLASYFGTGSKINENDIETFVYHSKNENVFTLFNKILASDLSGSLENLHKIVSSGQGNSVALFGGLSWQFKRLLAVSLLLDQNYSLSEAMKSLKIYGKRNEKQFQQARGVFSSRDLQHSIGLLAEYDGLARTTSGPAGTILLEMFLYYVIMRRGRTAEPWFERY